MTRNLDDECQEALKLLADRLRSEPAHSIRRTANADYAVIPSMKKKDLEKPDYDITCATWANAEVRGTTTAVLAAEMSGTDFFEMAQVLMQAKRMRLDRAPDTKQLQPGRTYRVGMFQWMLWGLASHRRKNLDRIHFAGRDWFQDLKRRLCPAPGENSLAFCAAPGGQSDRFAGNLGPARHHYRRRT